MSDDDLDNGPPMAFLGERPIFADAVRRLSDAATDHDPQTWKPANVPARKLFRCIESLRDLDLLLREAGRTKSRDKLRRKLKILHTPLHSLVEGIRDLANDLENNPDTFAGLPDNARGLIPKIKSQLLNISTIEKGGLLATMRDKMSAHVDKDLSIEKMQSLLAQLDPPQIGIWIHSCVSVLSDLMKLPVYFWSCHPNGYASLTIMFKEPFVVTLGLDDKLNVTRLLDIHMLARPPRYDIYLILKRLVRGSDWMFGPEDVKITGFSEDQPDESWAKSLNVLPKLSGIPAKQVRTSVLKKVFSDDGSSLLIPSNVPFFIKESTHRLADMSKLI